ncbi:hypothetical protein CDG79_27170 [Nostoc sp. 'Peltigera membranacea cyanobiont' 232]|nr:hypothetical protein CDG79_27170 [Nostoc sp. 'Peltigera membranacea cyanobiont' 232]
MLKTHTFIIKINPIVAKYTHKLTDKQAKQFEIKTEMFKEFRVKNPYKPSLYFSSYRYYLFTRSKFDINLLSTTATKYISFLEKTLSLV